MCWGGVFTNSPGSLSLGGGGGGGGGGSLSLSLSLSLFPPLLPHRATCAL